MTGQWLSFVPLGDNQPVFRRKSIFKLFAQTAILIAMLALVSVCAPATTPVSIPSTDLPMLTLTPAQTRPTLASILLPEAGESGFIAFSSDQDGDFEIWVMNQDGGDIRQLTDNGALNWTPAWQPGP